MSLKGGSIEIVPRQPCAAQYSQRWHARSLSAFHERRAGGALRRDRPRAMSDVARVDDEDDVLGNVRGVVSDALEVSRNENEVDTGLDRLWIAEHVGQQFPKD